MHPLFISLEKYCVGLAFPSLEDSVANPINASDTPSCGSAITQEPCQHPCPTGPPQRIPGSSHGVLRRRPSNASRFDERAPLLQLWCRSVRKKVLPIVFQ